MKRSLFILSSLLLFVTKAQALSFAGPGFQQGFQQPYPIQQPIYRPTPVPVGVRVIAIPRPCGGTTCGIPQQRPCGTGFCGQVPNYGTHGSYVPNYGCGGGFCGQPRPIINTCGKCRQKMCYKRGRKCCGCKGRRGFAISFGFGIRVF